MGDGSPPTPKGTPPPTYQLSPISIPLLTPGEKTTCLGASRGSSWLPSPGGAPTFATLRQGFEALPQDNWGYVAKINHYQSLDERHQTASAQIHLLHQELETIQVKQGLCQGWLEMGWAAHQVEHLHLGQPGAQKERNWVSMHHTFHGSSGRGHPL